jgi:hypothetical protein
MSFFNEKCPGNDLSSQVMVWPTVGNDATVMSESGG